MSLPLRGVTALSLTLYLKHMGMTSELLAALRKTKQLGKFSFVLLSLGHLLSLLHTVVQSTKFQPITGHLYSRDSRAALLLAESVS